MYNNNLMYNKLYIIFQEIYFHSNRIRIFFIKDIKKKKKKDLIIILEDVGITTEAIETVENRSTSQVEESKSATMVISDFYLEFYNKNYKKLSKKS